MKEERKEAKRRKIERKLNIRIMKEGRKVSELRIKERT